MDAAAARLPRIRPLEAIPFQSEHGPMVGLHDRQQIAPHSMAVTVPGYLLICQMDGKTTFAEARATLAEQLGGSPTHEQMVALTEALDQALLLDNERFAAEYARRRAAYRAGATRDNRERWPGADELRELLQKTLHCDKATTAPGKRLRGIIAPHLDYERGQPCYADAYAALAAGPPAKRYVILGTNHFGMGACPTATDKDFVTPLGRAPIDREFLRTLDARLDHSLCKHEFDHYLEHSIELHVHLLQTLFPTESFSIIPILCPDPSGPTGTAPRDGDGANLNDLADALGDLIERDGAETVLIASADLSHVGQRFGDPQVTTPEFLREVAQNDRRLLEYLTQGRESLFVEAVRASDNATRICSTGCIYALLRSLPRANCELLRYHQAVSLPTETHVTCAAAAIWNA